jgi:hypothetical protein
MEAIRSSETSALTRATWCHIPEDGIVHSHRRENLKWYNIKMDLSEVGRDGVDWIGLAQYRDQWRALANGATNLWDSKKKKKTFEKFLSGCTTDGFSGRAPLREGSAQGGLRSGRAPLREGSSQGGLLSGRAPLREGSAQRSSITNHGEIICDPSKGA